ncbi:hypothetical protein Pmar_PMAR018064 [Perkinsus marinus ATCC 50983]|uniref:Uncharacterized protein n=1 Tax=Perkinsus marinus (strain ATCC 50983 / TXsc) TaxID=423536 RepID=C5KRW8_PERM5|nr:hypothetical protein Pmar_PMAR018064 [Perkinsus marinus ATCC 50983]EER12809.1 hypothetical protein Pmar_PMAR018064 [Perkinsus marinus ATCC 50983]|eukprot:XP_002781014.1 hypothetical protein Pmar_PMAR018064 [Perkinsus marinus ATCC 50983]
MTTALLPEKQEGGSKSEATIASTRSAARGSKEINARKTSHASMDLLSEINHQHNTIWMATE